MPTKAQNEAAELKEAQAARMIALKQAAKKKEVRRARETKQISDELVPHTIKEQEDTTITKVITIMTMSAKLSNDGNYADALDSVYDNINIEPVRDLVKSFEVDNLTKKSFEEASLEVLKILFKDQNAELLMRTAMTGIPARKHGESHFGYHKRFMTASRANKFVMGLNGSKPGKSEKAEEAMLYLKNINCAWAQQQFLRDATGGKNTPDELMHMVQQHISFVGNISLDDGKIGGSKLPAKELAINHVHEERQSQVGTKRTRGHDAESVDDLRDLVSEIANLREQHADMREQLAVRNTFF